MNKIYYNQNKKEVVVNNIQYSIALYYHNNNKTSQLSGLFLHITNNVNNKSYYDVIQFCEFVDFNIEVVNDSEIKLNIILSDIYDIANRNCGNKIYSKILDINITNTNTLSIDDDIVVYDYSCCSVIQNNYIKVNNRSIFKIYDSIFINMIVDIGNLYTYQIKNNSIIRLKYYNVSFSNDMILAFKEDFKIKLGHLEFINCGNVLLDKDLNIIYKADVDSIIKNYNMFYVETNDNFVINNVPFYTQQQPKKVIYKIFYKNLKTFLFDYFDGLDNTHIRNYLILHKNKHYYILNTQTSEYIKSENKILANSTLKNENNNFYTVNNILKVQDLLEEYYKIKNINALYEL